MTLRRRVVINRKLVGYLKPDDAKGYRKQILKFGKGELVGRCVARSSLVGTADRKTVAIFGSDWICHTSETSKNAKA